MSDHESWKRHVTLYLRYVSYLNVFRNPLLSPLQMILLPALAAPRVAILLHFVSSQELKHVFQLTTLK